MADRDWRAVVDLRDERFRRDVERLSRLGPRVLYEMLADLVARHTLRTEIEELANRYARLDPRLLAAVGGDRWPPP